MADVEPGQEEHQQKAGQHEAEAGCDPTKAPACQCAEVDAKLVRLGSGQLVEVTHRISAGEARVTPGEAVTIGWPRDAGVCFAVGG